MLSHEDAQKQLKAFRLEDWLARRLAAARRLPKPLSGLALALLRRDAFGRSTMGPADIMYPLADMAQLDGLALAERQQVFAAVFGSRLAPHVERAWQIGRRCSYEYGYWRRPFRVPVDASLTLPSRSYWLDYLLRSLEGYEPDIAWAAAWAPYLGWYAHDCIGLLAAGAIEGGGDEGRQIYEILVASAQGEHPVGAMGRHVTRALLVANYPEGWDFIERLLLAAQRQEGLRQVILETIDEAHPEAFRRMLRLILDHDLTRFAATVRAADVWLGLHWNVEDIRTVKESLGCLQRNLDAAAAGTPTPVGRTPQEIYLALWACAHQDALAAVPQAVELLGSANVDQRFVAAHLLGQLWLEPAQRGLMEALADTDLRVATYAVAGLQTGQWRIPSGSDVFERLEALLPRCPRKTQTVAAPVWPWLKIEIGQPVVAAALVRFLFDRSPERILPYLPMMDANARLQLVMALAGQTVKGAATRQALLALIGDASDSVRLQAHRALEEIQITPEEAPDLEALLTRKPADLRASVLELLLTQADEAALKSGQRLLASRNPLQRLAGLDLLRHMAEGQRLAGDCRSAAAAYRGTAGQIAPAEQELLDVLCKEDEPDALTLDNGLGLFDPARRTRPPEIRLPRRWGLLPAKPAPLVTEAAVACLKSLDALIHEHRADPTTVRLFGDREREDLLGNLGWAFPVPNPRTSLADDLPNLPLCELWETWWRERPAELRDRDGLELLRALAPLHYHGWGDHTERAPWLRATAKALFGDFSPDSLGYAALVSKVLTWLLRSHPVEGRADFLLDAVAYTLALVPINDKADSLLEAVAHRLAVIPKELHKQAGDWRERYGILSWLELARRHQSLCPSEWSTEHHVRLWGLLRWIDEPAPGSKRQRPHLEEVLAAHAAGAATEDDLLDQLIGPQGDDSRLYYHFADLQGHSGRQPSDLAQCYPILAELVQRCRDRITQVELKRGDLPTAASGPALAIRWAGGMKVALPLVKALGSDSFARGYLYADHSHSAVFSHLVRSTTPLEGETPEAFALAAKAAGISQRRLVELAVYAPQWAIHVEVALGWAGLAEAVWWMHAHTKDTGWAVDLAMRELWQAQVAQHTPLTGQELMDGAVDVLWFHRAYAALGPARWADIYRAALYASGGLGHKRAQLFADAMLGQISRETLLTRARDKRQGDAVRALGLLPLPADGQEDEIRARYEVIQEFLRTSRQFGSQRQASEKLAATIGLQNLARTAGYPDPLRLQWAMEARSAADLARGPAVVTIGEVSVALAINGDGEAELSVTKMGKPLKTLPAAVKKAPEVVALSERKTEIKRQAVRMRQSLEQAMCRGDGFTGRELRELSAHPVLTCLLSDLVLIGDGKIGYLAESALGLCRHDGMVEPLGQDDAVRIAHPHDLLGTREWHIWQRECFLAGRSQPFKQIFRELYLLTEAERTDGTVSRRYAGHQIQTRQGQALLSSRGWVTHFEEGTSHTFHEQNLTAWLGIANGTWTPAEVEGLTIEGVWFTRRGDWQHLPLEQVPPLVFSETMRDLDLLVSVAHMGGVDPEATASTTEMRAALVRETCAMLKLANVRVQNNHVLVEGQLGSYAIHLGSAVVHRQPGGALCIVPVHAQHRGRLFLPFADNDPKTAEVLSKVLLLAKDQEIKDPVILQQILA